MITGIELWKKIDKQITDHPETHFQGSWEADYSEFPGLRGDGLEMCGTTRCLAGWAIAFNSLPGEELCDARDRLAADLGVGGPWDDPYMTVAASLLGLGPERARELFLNISEGEIAEVVHEMATGGS